MFNIEKINRLAGGKQEVIGPRNSAIYHQKHALT